MTSPHLHHARRMRSDATDAERVLWRELRAGRSAGCKFRRQQPLGNYIVDFVSLESKLVIEVDGGQQVVHSVTHALNPNFVGTEQVRNMSFSTSGELTLSASDTVPGTAVARHHRLIWRRNGTLA